MINIKYYYVEIYCIYYAHHCNQRNNVLILKIEQIINLQKASLALKCFWIEMMRNIK